MKTYRILGILWLALCCYDSFSILWQLSHIWLQLSHNVEPLNFKVTRGFLIVIFFVILYLAGVVASIYLFRGARWALGVIRVVAILTVIAVIAQIIEYRSLSLWGGVIGAFAIVSVVLLFLPRHEPVA